MKKFFAIPSAAGLARTAFTTCTCAVLAVMFIGTVMPGIPTASKLERRARANAGHLNVLMARENGETLSRNWAPAYEFQNYELHHEGETLEDRVDVAYITECAQKSRDEGFRAFAVFNGNEFDTEEIYVCYVGDDGKLDVYADRDGNDLIAQLDFTAKEPKRNPQQR